MPNSTRWLNCENRQPRRLQYRFPGLCYRDDPGRSERPSKENHKRPDGDEVKDI